MSVVPAAANASYYAEIVSERAVLRRMVTAGTRIVQMGYAAEGDVHDLVDRAQPCAIVGEGIAAEPEIGQVELRTRASH